MKIDRFVKVMLVLIAGLLALNCAKDLSLSSHSRVHSNNTSSNAGDDSNKVSAPNSVENSSASIFESSVEAALPPSFLQVGKSYEAVVTTDTTVTFKVLEGQNTGWVKVQVVGGKYDRDSGNIVLLNPNAFLYIKAIE